ncbi:DNA-binding response regulator [Paracoccus versutus]|nr:DNA-binding response regulator [Paracoccus versutus]
MAGEQNGVRVLLVEDEETVRQLHGAVLVGAGCVVDEAPTLASFRDRLARTRYDVVLLDLSLPDGNALAAISEIRRETSAGIIVATANRDLEDRLAGLERGADEYLEKPVHPRELVSRVRNLAERLAASRRNPATELVHHFQGWSVDLAARIVRVPDGGQLHLTENEFRLLDMLIRNAGKAVHRERLLTILDSGEEVMDRAVDKAIYRLRVKLHAVLGQAAPLIETVHGFGYRFIAESL